MRDALPNASFTGFTGTPLEHEDKNTRAVFGDYISVYGIQPAVDDKATVPIYCEGRLTMDADKPMRAHGLMQAIARVNRVFRDKPGGWWWTTWASPAN
ncbi:hypothetical protein MPNT_170057 [Candidatus Methylacidithermus pantelleriae]|uniref:SWI2/SNF2 ATPase domain-containing protein n=1 Tax=Candidatus Methylacidithermus pantelleriae TaxID=2744239 RepID=A0A8J2FVQ0_9BACT|nr:hypothetical protein MPNT_170057 [Candidatus Methylacidithermus pantelleriae]